MKKIELGCGINRHEGFIPCDISDNVGAEYVFNAEIHKWPFEDNSVEEVLAENLCEHLHNLDWFMQEAWRVLKPNGKLNIMVPYFKHSGAFSDPDHVRFFTEHSMNFYSKLCLGSDGRPVDRGLVDFDMDKLTWHFDSKLLAKHNLGLKDAYKGVSEQGKYFDLVDFLRYELIAIKPARGVVK